MGDNQKFVALPRDWPSGDWCPPKAVIDRMTRAEAGALIASVQRELGALASWNQQRQETQPKPPAWEVAPPPSSPNDYGKLRTR